MFKLDETAMRHYPIERVLSYVLELGIVVRRRNERDRTVESP